MDKNTYPVIDLDKIKADNFNNLDQLHPYYRSHLFFDIGFSITSPILYEPIFKEYPNEKEYQSHNYISWKHIEESEIDSMFHFSNRLYELLKSQRKKPIKIPASYMEFEPKANDLITVIPGIENKVRVIDGLIHHCVKREKGVGMHLYYFENAKLNFLVKRKAFLELIKEKEKASKEDQKVKNPKNLPYQIALLKGIGFFDLPLVKNLNGQQQREIIQKLFGGSDRQIKGNINVLNPHSKDDRIRYTSFKYEDEVNRYITGLFDI